MAATREGSRQRRVTVGFALGVALVVGAAWVASIGQGQDSVNSSGGVNPQVRSADLLDSFGPLGSDGEKVASVDDVREISPVLTPALRPQSEIGSDATIQEVWVRGGDYPKMVVEYSTGLSLIVNPYASEVSPSKETPEEMFQEIIDTGTPGKLEMLGKTPALVIHPGVAGSNPGSVQFVADGQLVQLIGDSSGKIDSDALWSAALQIYGTSTEASSEAATGAS